MLLRCLENSFPEARIAALSGLLGGGDRGVADPLPARLSDEIPRVRAQAVATLTELGSSRVRPTFEVRGTLTHSSRRRSKKARGRSADGRSRHLTTRF